MSTLLETRDLSVRFTTDRGAVYALDSVSLSLQAEEVTAIVGESGCGKSVLAMSILGLAGPGARVSGSVLFEGLDLCTLSTGQLRRIRGKDIGIVFQEPMTALNPVLTAGSQVEEVLRRHEGLGVREARVRTIQLFEQVGISAPEQRANAYPHQLSGGMAQRVMIAMAIACRPRLLIADEPTTALDVTIQAGILRLLLDLRKRSGMSIMLITHDLGVVAEMADRVVVMYAGRAVETAAVESIFSAPQHPYTIGLLGATRRPEWTPGSNRRRRLQEIPGMVPTRRTPADHCWFDERCPRADEWCSTHVPELAPRSPDHLAACFHPGQETHRVVEPVHAVP